jgi:hypothetical protein
MHERFHAAAKCVRVKRGWRDRHIWNIIGTKMRRKSQGRQANVQ